MLMLNSISTASAVPELEGTIIYVFKVEVAFPYTQYCSSLINNVKLNIPSIRSASRFSNLKSCWRPWIRPCQEMKDDRAFLESYTWGIESACARSRRLFASELVFQGGQVRILVQFKNLTHKFRIELKENIALVKIPARRLSDLRHSFGLDCRVLHRCLTNS